MSDDAIETGMVSLPDAVCAEMTRVRDRVLGLYVGCAAKEPMLPSRTSFAPAIAMMRLDLDRAANALAHQDAAELVRVLESLRGWQP